MDEQAGPFGMMRPSQALRLWIRRAPVSERVVTGVAVLILMALLGWLVAPGADDQEEFATTGSASLAGEGEAPATRGAVEPVHGSGQTATSPAGGGGATGAADGLAPLAQPGGAPRSSAGEAVAAPTVERGCQSPPGRAKGITDTEVRVVIALVEIVGPAANALFGLDPPEEQEASFNAAIAGINREGGVACRKLVARYVRVNPLDESQMIGVCRDVAAGDEFALVDGGGLGTRPAVLACLGQNKIPSFGTSQLTDFARRQFFPYLFAFYYREQVYRSTATALREIGFFDSANGFEKLGFAYRDCEPQAIAAFRRYLRESVSDDDVVTYNVGCPAAFASESDLAQAVLTFRRAGVTHVTTGNFTGDIARFTSHAEQQRFRPKYGLPDEALLAIEAGSRAPNPDNVANAIAVTLTRLGEQRTPGMSPTPGTLRCNAYRRAAGLEPVWKVAATAGQACGQLWMLTEALKNAPQLSREALSIGLQRAKSIDFSFPQGPSDFTGDKVTSGGQFWRLARFMPDCDCWRVTQRDFRRGPPT